MWHAQKPILIKLLIVVWLISGCSHESASPLKLGTNVWPGYEPLYLAREQQNWSAKGIHLAEYPSASEVLRAFRNHAIDAASLTLDEVLLLRQDEIPLTVVLVHDVSDGADVIMAKPGIESVKDLKNRRVAVEASALGAYVITRALSLNQLTLADIKVVKADVNLHESLYREGKVDAVVTFEPVRTRLSNQGAHEIFSSKELPNEIVDVLVVHNDYLAKYPSQVRVLVADWFKALSIHITQPEVSTALMARRLKITPQEVLEGYKGLHIPDRNENRRLLAGKQSALNDTVKKLMDVLLQHKLLKKSVDVTGLFSDQYLGE